MIPRAEEFRAKLRIRRGINGTIFTSKDGWYWAEPTTCPAEVESYDPWACNFISLTNCTRFETGVSLMSPPYPAPTDHVFYLFKFFFLAAVKPSGPIPKQFFLPGEALRKRGFDVASGSNSPSIMELREKFADAPLEADDQWVSSSIIVWPLFILTCPSLECRFTSACLCSCNAPMLASDTS